MKHHYIFYFLILTFCGTGASFAQTTAPGSIPKPTPTMTLEDQKKSLELERLQLENDKLKLEMEKLKFQASQTPSAPAKTSDAEKKRTIDALQTSILQKTEGIAKENKDKDDLMVLDLLNSEIWHK